MPTITESIGAFLEAETERVSENTVETYAEVLESMAGHLDTCGNDLLSAEELDDLVRTTEGRNIDDDGREGVFCGTFDVENALTAYHPFYFWFLIRKVAASESMSPDAAGTGSVSLATSDRQDRPAASASDSPPGASRQATGILHPPQA